MRNRRGFALLTALWLAVAIAVASLQLAMESRQQILAAGNLSANTRSRQAALAAIDLTRARVDLALRRSLEAGVTDVNSELYDAWMTIDSVYSVAEEIGDLTVQLNVRSLGARMNLNRATETELLNFFVAMELDYSYAEELSQGIMDWRDTDGNYRPRGGEKEQYEHEGLLNLPRNNLFESVDEVRHVRGMTQEIFEMIEPYMTVWGSGRINLNTAERPVLLSLTGMTENAVNYLYNLRQSGQRLNNVNQLQPYLSGQQLPNNRTALLVDELEIEAVSMASDGWPLLRAWQVLRRGNQQATTSNMTNWRIE
jgi:general secretion pathway protein K